MPSNAHPEFHGLFKDHRYIVTLFSLIALLFFAYGSLFNVSVSSTVHSNVRYTVSYTGMSVKSNYVYPIMEHVPKVAYLLWDKGWQYAPEMQKMCLNSFHRHNINFTINAVSLEEAEYMINRPAFYRDKAWGAATIQAKSDIIRVELLARHGGVWADATVYLNQPLLSWLNDTIMQAGFLLYERRDPLVNETTRPWIAPWFIVAARGSLIMRLWRDEIRKQWRNDPIPPLKLGYFWVHRIFQRLANTNKQFEMLYNKMPFMDADVPHCWTGRWTVPPLYKIKAPGCCEMKTKMLKIERTVYKNDTLIL